MYCNPTVRVYNNERTLCDILGPNSSADIQIISESFKRYATGKEKHSTFVRI